MLEDAHYLSESLQYYTKAATLDNYKCSVQVYLNVVSKRLRDQIRRNLFHEKKILRFTEDFLLI